MGKIFTLWATIRDFLFPMIEEEIGPMSEKMRQFVAVCELAGLDHHMAPFASRRLGRRRLPRVDFAKAFVAKAVHNFPTTEALIEYLKHANGLRRLCGWEHAADVPNESTFSRAFDEFAKKDLGQRVHEAMVKAHCGDKLAGHIARDATKIVGREKAAPKPCESSRPARPKRKRGRPRKSEPPREPPPLTRLQLQPSRSLAANLADLPQACDWGCKKNSQGKTEQWKGYKLHIDTIDGGIPVSAILTSASVHDSQAAIPLAQMSAARVTNLYDLMDAAYDAKPIQEFSCSLGHRPIIDANARGGQTPPPPMDPATAIRYNERSTSERANSQILDNHGGRFVRVRGHAKVLLHLMFGVITTCGLQVLRLAPDAPV